VLAKSNADINR